MIHRLKSLFAAEKIEDKFVLSEMRKSSLLRIIISCTGATLFSASVVSIYYQNKDVVTANAIYWKESIIALNCFMMAANACIVAAGLYAWRYKSSNHFLYSFILFTVMLVMGVWAVAGTTLHQLINWTVIPFVLASFVFSMLLIRPNVLFYFYIVLYIAFYFCLPIYQHNPNYVLLSRSLGFGTLFASYCFSSISWNSNVMRFRQNRLIELQTEALKESNASKDKFFSILSHDLKGPVATSLLLTELLQDDNVGEQERKEIQQLFRSSLENISRLLNNVLLWANNQTGKISFNPESLNLKAAVDEDIQMVHAMAVHKNITVINEIASDFKVLADQHMMHTIIRNLLTNAIKFSHSGGRVTISAALTKENNTSFSKLCIADNGVGISPALLGDLFKLDKKIMTPGTNNETGTGLGLILCKDFIEKHNGRLVVESEESTGSRFTILLPQS